MSQVAPGLYVGDANAASSISRLAHHGITHVLNCTDKPNPLEGRPGAPCFKSLGLVDNNSDLPEMQVTLRAGVDFIHAALAGATGNAVLVHCHRGISRSCTLAMAYLIWQEQRPAEDTFEAIRAVRRVCDPNLGYWCAIKEWERSVLPVHLQRSLRSQSLTPASNGRSSAARTATCVAVAGRSPVRGLESPSGAALGMCPDWALAPRAALILSPSGEESSLSGIRSPRYLPEISAPAGMSPVGRLAASPSPWYEPRLGSPCRLHPGSPRNSPQRRAI